MALTTLTVQHVNATPGEMKIFGPTTPAASDGFVAATSEVEFANDGKTILFIVNAQAAATTAIGFTMPTTSYAGMVYAASGAGDTVTAAKNAVFGPFPTALNDSGGKIQVTIGSLTTVYVAALSLG